MDYKGWSKTKKGKRVYKSPPSPFKLTRVSVILEKLMSKGVDDVKNNPDAAVWQIFLSSRKWMHHRDLFKSIYGARSSEIQSWAKSYIDFIKWFDGILQFLDPVLDIIERKAPLLTPVVEFVKNAEKLYKFVREVFPIE